MALWKEVRGYEGLYLISDEGIVVALPKTIHTVNGKIFKMGKKTLKTHLRGRSPLMYEAVTLTKDKISKSYSIHRLVAEAFIPNPNNYPEVNHKDENPLNNRVDNLEWCSREYNIQYSKNKKVAQIDKMNNVVSVYKSINEASEKTGIMRTSISNVLNGWSKTSGGYIWEYCED